MNRLIKLITISIVLAGSSSCIVYSNGASSTKANRLNDLEDRVNALEKSSTGCQKKTCEKK